MNGLKNWWNNFEQKHPKASKWVREGGLFFIFSNLVTVVQYIIYAFHVKSIPNRRAGIAGQLHSIPARPSPNRLGRNA